MLEARKVSLWLMRKLRAVYNAPDDMKDLAMNHCAEKSVVRTWQNAIDYIVDYGAKALLEYNPELANSIGIDEHEELDDVNDREPWLIRTVRAEFTSQLRVQHNIVINSSDDLSSIGYRVSDARAVKADKWASYSTEQWTAWADQRGNNAVVRGGVKRGKTNFSLLLSELFLSLDWEVVANIYVVNAPPGYHYAATLSDMIIKICEARMRGKRVLILFDEGALSWGKIDTIQAQNKALAKILLTLGKLWSTLVYITHFKSDVPTAVAKTVVADFEKRGVKTIDVTINAGLSLSSRSIESVPMTNLNYNPDQPQYMTVDMDVDAMFQYMSRVTEVDKQWSELRNWVKENARGMETSLSPKDVALFIDAKAKECGEKISVRNIAKLTGASKSAVAEWISAPRRTDDDLYG